MLIEALKPLTVCLPEGTLHLDPGQPVDLPTEQARQLLAKVPGKVRLVEVQTPGLVPEADLRPAPVTDPEDIGRVVMVTSMSDQKNLAVILDAKTIEERAHLKQGRWVCVAADNMTRWLHHSLIVDQAPSCQRCHSHNWWWTDTGMIRCSICYPPHPDWLTAWRELAQATNGITKEHPVFGAIMQAMEHAHTTYLGNDYPGFQRAAAKLYWLLRDTTP